MPKVSIVIPVYNVEGYVEKCARSVLVQTERDFELILVDDGSTDGSGAVCDRLAGEDPRVRVIHQENAGLGGARNTGIKAARGDWLLFVDSDDWIEPEILGKALAAGEETGAGLVIFSYRTVDEQGRVMAEYREDLEPGKVLEVSEHPELFLISPCAWNKLYRAELFRESGVLYPPRVWYEDIRTTLKLLPSAGKAFYLPEIGYDYLQRQGSITNNLNADRNGEIIDAFEDILGWFRETGNYERYREELCFLTVLHVYLTASVRVLRIDRKHPLLGKFREYTLREFPDWKKNRYLQKLGKKRKLLLFLLERRCYGLIGLLFKIKG